MSNFPSNFDDDTTLPIVNNNLTEIGGESINALRDAVVAIEQNIGLTAAGSVGSIAARLGIAIAPDGQINASALTSLGLVTLPINDSQISPMAQISESKLRLDHRTQDLFNYVRDLSKDINLAIGWVSISGVKLEPHLIGAIYRHSLNQIDVTNNASTFPYLNNKFNLLRDNSDSYHLVNDINNELLAHQFADGSPAVPPTSIITNNGSVYPATHAHTASGIFLNTSRFAHVPQSKEDLQLFAEYVDSNIIAQLSILQNLNSNGISRTSRSSSLSIDGYGPPVVSITSAIAYLNNIGTSSSPYDSITTGDDIIEFKPSTFNSNNNIFDAQFALVKVGDIVTINYGTGTGYVKFVIKEKKYIQNVGNKKYIIRIAGKNLAYAPNAQARIDRALVNFNKYGILAVAPANNGFSQTPSLIVGSPRSAQALGLGFNPDQFDASHYLLYLALYPTGHAQDGYTILPAIDVTGNQGTTPGIYTLDSIVEATNLAFRQVGYNYRFIAFSYQGEFGIMLADSYNNAAFSILNAVVDGYGFFDSLATNIYFHNNVIGIFASTNARVADPLGFGSSGANIASPPYMTLYQSAESAQGATKLFVPLKSNNTYINGIERDRLSLEVGQALDGYGDGYWVSTVQNITITPGPSPTGRVETTYRILLDLSTSNLQIGKTIVVQPLSGGTLADYGRFTIGAVSFGCAPNEFTDITVYDAVHATGISPYATLVKDDTAAIYFNSDSVSFNKETATDFTGIAPFKRHFEVYINENGNTFTHERGRIFIGGGSSVTVNGSIPLVTYSELAKLNIIKISPKLRGYQFGSVNKICLNMISYNSSTGIYDGYLSSFDGTAVTSHKGPRISGKKGEVTRFYDETNIDYIDIIFQLEDGYQTHNPISTFSDKRIDFQLFPTLSLDDEIMPIATCQLNDTSNIVNYVRDERQFGNVSEKELTTSALNFMSLPERLLHGNGIIRGFDLEDTGAVSNPNGAQIYMAGGLALVNGKFIQTNNQTVIIPLIKEFPLYNINWALCVNDKGEYQPIPLLDYDPALNTPTGNTRLFQAFNLVNGANYYIDASTFSDLINNRKDLTIIYIVAATATPGVGVTPPSISLSITDARRYINDADTNLPLRLTSSNAQGNFKSPVSILNWIKYNNIFNGTAIVKGADATSGVISTDINLNFLSTVTIEGENDALLKFNGAVTLGSNLTFSNLDLEFNGGISLNTNLQNLIFKNCNVTITIPQAKAPANNIIFDLINTDNVIIKDCLFTIVYQGLIPTPSPLTDISKYGGVFRVTNSTNFVVDNSIINVSYVSNPGTYVPGDMFILVTSNNVIIKDSDFTGNFNRFIGNSNSNFLKLSNLTVTSTFNPLISISDFSFNSTNFVNSGQGYIYSNVSGTLNDIVIDNVVFTYNPGTSSANRFSFINFELSTNNSILSNLVITNCRFNHNNFGNAIEDVRPAISIINTFSAFASATASNAQQPLLLNAKITGNVCNRNQSIIVTSRLDSSNLMNYPGLVAQNCIIRDNVCGTIGYWVAAATKVVSIIPNANSLTDKTNGLLIENNICHYITNVEHTGNYFLVSKLISGASTTIAVASNGVNLTTTINVASTASFSTSGTLFVTTSNGIQTITYTGTNATQFTGCNGTTGSGTMATGGAVSQVISVNQSKYPSGYATIRGNRTSWIHTGISFEESSSLQIVDNSLVAYDIAYINQFNDIIPNTYGSSGLSSGYAIFVSSNKHVITSAQTPGEGNDSAVLISGNSIATGYWIQLTGTSVIYKYLTGYIFTQPSVNIINNHMKGVSTSGGNLVLLGGTKSVVTNNTIHKQGNTVSAYVAFSNTAYDAPAWGSDSLGVGAGTIGIVTDNFFDSPFLNDSLTTNSGLADANELLVNIPSVAVNHWIVERNKNQTGYAFIPLTNQFYGNGGNGFGPYPVSALLATAMNDVGAGIFNGGYRSQALQIVDSATAAQRFFGIQENIESHLPNRVRIISLKAGLRPYESVVSYSTSAIPGDTGNFFLNISRLESTGTSTQDITNTNYFSSSAAADTSIAELNGHVFSIVTGGQINSTYSNVPYFINLESYGGSDISYNYITGLGKSISLSFDARWIRVSSTIHLTISPILIKYRW